ncbi:MAG: hypothetical protein Q4F84_09200 [Fibrobacter sp.]|nr:hypothetical protein [Fibrobacter sp.]
MKAALFEGHIAPVYMDGDIPIFIETTRYCSVMYINFMKTLHGLPIKLLSQMEFLAVHLSNRAFAIYERVGLTEDAIFLIDNALEIFPDYTAGWINRALIMKQTGNTKEMKKSIEMAKSLNPGPRYSQAIMKIEQSI